MSKYYKAEDVIRKRAEDLADTSYWEYGNPKNVDEWIEVAEMEFKDLPIIEVSKDCVSREQVIETIDGVDWYHVNSVGKLVHGAASNETALYRAEDIYRAIESLPSVASSVVRCEDCADYDACDFEFIKSRNGYCSFGER